MIADADGMLSMVRPPSIGGRVVKNVPEYAISGVRPIEDTESQKCMKKCSIHGHGRLGVARPLLSP